MQNGGRHICSYGPDPMHADQHRLLTGGLAIGFPHGALQLHAVLKV